MSKTTALVLVLLSIGLFYTYTSPQYASVGELTARAGEYRNVINNVSRIIETRDNLLASYDTIPSAEKERLAKILPSNADAVGLARDLDTIASQYGISIKSVQVESEASQDSRLIVLPEFEKPYDKALVSFSFISDYPNFIKFMNDLEKSLRLMNVESVSFRTAESGLYEHQLTVETYWLK